MSLWGSVLKYQDLNRQNRKKLHHAAKKGGFCSPLLTLFPWGRWIGYLVQSDTAVWMLSTKLLLGLKAESAVPYCILFSHPYFYLPICFDPSSTDCLQTSCASSTFFKSLLVCSPRNEQCDFLASVLNVCMWCHGIPLHYAAGIYFPANFYTLLIDTGSTPNLHSTLTQKESPTTCSALLALVVQGME